MGVQRGLEQAAVTVTAMSETSIWQQVQQGLRHQMSEPSFETWLAPMELRELSATHAVFATDSGFKRDWINKHYKALIESTFQEVTGHVYTVALVLDGVDDTQASAKGLCPIEDTTVSAPKKQRRNALKTPLELGLDEAKEAVQQRLLSPRTVARSTEVDTASTYVRHNSANLNPKYTFDTMVVGKHNQFCYAAALAISENPAHSYNPFFVYGGVGLGKTHLIQSIGHFIQHHEPDKKVKYVTAEQFTNELITALGKKDWNSFRDRYRKIDVLIIDDIQFLSGKERTQQELFHTFNALHEAGKQIILSSDRSPKQLAELEDRLRSRFEWGLIAEIQPPDIETRIAILQKKAAQKGLLVPDAVCHYLAEVCDNNVRELEGALNKVTAYSMLTDTPLQLDQIAPILGIEPSPSHLSLDTIIKTVAEYYYLTAAELKSDTRARDVSQARQIAVYLMRKLTDASFPKIGKALGNRKHSSVLYGYKQMVTALDTQPLLKKQMGEIELKLSNTL